MNLTEMEAKVREATNNEPWGAPSTLMKQIAAGTMVYREREEIISFIFRRFTEKAANEWRQIYKALQLLDYLIRNGSERVIDDVRANLSLIQMLKSFHYIDSKGRDQGINVRNRAKNLIALLNDDAQIRTERKKAKTNAKKFGGVSSAAYGGASSINPNAEDDGDFTNRVFGDGGVYGARYGDSAEEYNNANQAGGSSNDNFEEYNVEGNGSSSRTSRPTTSINSINASRSKPQPQEPDLLSDLDFGGSSNTNTVPQADDDDDEFDDFQSAPTATTQSAGINNLSNLYSSNTNFQQPQPQQVSGYQSQPQQVSSYQSQPSSNFNFSSNSTPTVSKVPSSKNNDAFSSLFNSAKSKTSSRTPSATHNANSNSKDTTSNDDVFGDFSSNNNSNGNSKSNNSNSNSGDIDLLSF